MRAVRYLLCPGYIISKNDGDRHYISAGQLKQLYKVNWEDCDIEKQGLQLSRYNYIRLFPRYDGNYTDYPKLEVLKHDK